MSEFPRTTVGGLSMPRMIIGTNWFLGFSHTSHAKDELIRKMMTPPRIADVMEVFMNAGVDAILGGPCPPLLEAKKDAEDRTGRKCILVSIPSLGSLGDDAESMADCERVFDAQAAGGVDICMPHQCTTDALVDRRSRTIRNMDKYVAMIRERGMIPGLSTHMPETIPYADETGLDVETYVQIYNAIGFLMQVEVDWVHRGILNAAKPVITIKPFAAGRLHPLVGLAFGWATIREQDMIAVGTQTPDEARELIEMSHAQFEHRAAAVELQRTRSKESIQAK